ncbi:MAG: hypothetical protein H7Z12_19520 [Rhodospirillaceae bacterium]|nr:hypothetical protein [Rhodospirillales bacterium]
MAATLVGGSGEDTLTGNTSDDTVTVNDNTENDADTTQTNDGNATGNGGQIGDGDQVPTQGGQNSSDQPEDEQVAGVPKPRKPTEQEVREKKGEILNDQRPDDGEDKSRSKPDADKSPLEIGKDTADQMGISGKLIENEYDAAVIQGVANFRFLDKDAQNKVMQDIGKLDNQLAGQLRAKVADLQVQPEWNPRSMKDDELLAAAERNKANALILRGLGMAPGRGGGAFGWYADQFDKSAEQMRQELERRGINKERH